MKKNTAKNKRNCLILFLLIVIFNSALFCKKINQKEKEPNNDIFTSNKIEPDTIIEGYLDTPDDSDVFKINILGPTILDIDLGPVKGLNHAIKIWKGGDQILLKYIDDSRKSSAERMCNVFTDIGAYYIAVLHGDRDKPKGNAEDEYKLRISARPWEREEVERNDNYEDSNLLEIGSDFKGYFSPSFNKLNRGAITPYREEDWYYFNIDLIDEHPMLLDIKLSGVPYVNSLLFLLDEEKKEIASSDLNTVGEGEILEDIGIIKSGKYYVLITSNFESNNEIPYSIFISSRSYDYSSEIEPNNYFEKSNIIMDNELTGRIFPEGDKDYYTFNRVLKVEKENSENQSVEAENRFIYKIEAQSENLDLVLHIFNNEKKKLFDIDNVKGGGKEIMPNAFLSDNFFIEVTSNRGINDPGTEYILSVSSFPFSINYEIEPNEKKDSATIVDGARITGFISKKEDKDFYILKFNKRVRKNITLHGIKDSELKISITDPLGYIIKTEHVNGNESKSFIEMIDQKGYLIVEALLENYDEPYIIEIGDL